MPDEWDGPDDGMFGDRPKANGHAKKVKPDEFDRERAADAGAEVERMAAMNARALAREMRYAAVIAEQFALACQSDPQRMAEAFAQVFDLSAYEEMARNLLATFSFTRRAADETQAEVAGIKHYIELLNQQIDKLTAALFDAERQVKELRAEIAAARPAAVKGGQHKAPGPE